MKYEGDIGLYLSGCPVLVPQCNIAIVQPKVKDIILFGETDFFVSAQMLGDISKFVKPVKEGNSELSHRNDFQIFLEIMRTPGTGALENVKKFFDLCCPDLKVQYKRNSIDFIANDAIVGRINQMTYHFFCRTVSELFLPHQEEEEVEYNYDKNNAAAVRLAEKIKRNRERLKKAMGQDESQTHVSVFGLYASILAIGCNNSIQMYFDYTPFQLYDAFERYMAKQQSDLFTQISMVPFADTSDQEPPESWMRNLYDGHKKEQYNSFSKFNETIKGRGR